MVENLNKIVKTRLGGRNKSWFVNFSVILSYKALVTRPSIIENLEK